MADKKEVEEEKDNYTALIFSVVAIAISCFAIGFQLGKLL